MKLVAWMTITLSAACYSLEAESGLSYGKLPLRFEANDGQTDARVKFLSHGSKYMLFLTQD